MKKHTRSLLSLLLVILLIASFAIPAMAIIQVTDYTEDGIYKYTYSIEKKTSTGVANISLLYAPTYVTAKAVNVLNYSVGGSSVKVSRTITGYASATAIAGNTFTHDGTSKTASIKHTTAEFMVDDEKVLTEGDAVDA